VPYIDLLIVVVLALFAGTGFWKGFFVEALTFVGFFVALFVTLLVYQPLGAMIAGLLKLSHPRFAQVLCFIILFILITFGFSLVGQMLTKATKKLRLSGLNRAFGAVFGGLKGAFLCGVFLAVIVEKNLFTSLTAHAKDSLLAPLLMKLANWMLDLFHL
jgi:membrane protein required for colicin V production